MNDFGGARSLREIVRILFEHWLMLWFVVVLGGGGTWAICEYVAPRQYRSHISLIFKRPLNKNPIATDTGERMLEVFVKAQQQILMSDLVLARTKVISEDSALRERWHALRSTWEKAQAEAGAELGSVQRRIAEFLTEGVQREDTVAGKVRQVLEHEQTDFQRFRRSVKLETPGGEQVAMTESFTITVDRPADRNVPGSHLNAMYAADVLADMYMVRYQQLEQRLNDPALQVMDNIVNAFRKEVDARRDAYHAFIQDNPEKVGVLEQLLKSGTEHGIQIILTKVRENDATLFLDLTRDRAVYDAMKAALPAKAAETGGIDAMSDAEVAVGVRSIPIDFLKDDAGFVEMAKNIANLEARRARIETQYMEESRDLKYVREQLRRTYRQLLAAAVAHTNGLKASIRAREEQQADYAALVESTTQEQNEIHSKLAVYARIKNDFEVAQRQLEKLEQERIDALSNKLRSREAVTISKLDAASTPDVEKPVVPLTTIYTVVAAAVSLLLGVAMAFLADHFDHTLRSTIEAERYLGLPVLGSVKRRGRRLVTQL